MVDADRAGRETYAGPWWLPAESEAKAAYGTLRIGAKYPQLTLQAVNRSAGSERIAAPVVFGRSSGACLTLLDVTQIGGNESSSLLSVGTVLIGRSHRDSKDLQFNRVVLRLPNLEEWAHRPAYPPFGEPLIELELPVLSAYLPECEVFLARNTESYYGRLTEAGFRSRELITIHLHQDYSLDDIEYRFIRPLEQFMTLACGDSCAAFQVQVGRDDGSNSSETWPSAAYFVRRRSSDMVHQGRRVYREHMRFGMNNIGYPPNINFGELVPRWFELRGKLNTICDLIFSLRSDSGGYLQQQMFTGASALEAMHRESDIPDQDRISDDEEIINEILELFQAWKPEQYDWLKGKLRPMRQKAFVDRILELLKSTEPLMNEVVGNATEWARELKKVRNGIGHVSPYGAGKQTDQLIAMFYSARIFAEIILMRKLEFSVAECRRSFGHNWELENVRALAEKGYPDWFPVQ